MSQIIKKINQRCKYVGVDHQENLIKNANKIFKSVNLFLVTLIILSYPTKKNMISHGLVCNQIFRKLEANHRFYDSKF